MNTLMGIKVVESPLIQPVPKITVRDIKLKDGTSILSPAFLAKENEWYLERFGKKNVAYMFDTRALGGLFGGGDKIVAMNPASFAALRNFS